MSNNNYGINDIKTLEGIEAIRLRPGMSETIEKYTPLEVLEYSFNNQILSRNRPGMVN